MLAFLQIIHFLAVCCFLCSPKVQQLDLQRYLNFFSVKRCTDRNRVVHILDIEVLEDVEDESEIKAEESQLLV